MTCAACGGDGQIEVGAYRGDDASDTRTCQLCGGRPSGLLEKLGQAATDAGVSMGQLAQSFSRRTVEGDRIIATVTPTGRTTVTAPSGYIKLDRAQQREVAMQIARSAVGRRKEEAERERQERLAHPVTLPDTGQMSGEEIMDAIRSRIHAEIPASNFGPNCYELELERESYRKGLGL